MATAKKKKMTNNLLNHEMHAYIDEKTHKKHNTFINKMFVFIILLLGSKINFVAAQFTTHLQAFPPIFVSFFKELFILF